MDADYEGHDLQVAGLQMLFPCGRHPAVTGTRVIVSLPKISMTFTAMM
jgi:hypothetical protein